MQLAIRDAVSHDYRMAAQSTELPPLPSAPFDDLDLDTEEGQLEWQRRLTALAAARIEAARTRLERLGVIDVDGTIISQELPPDMRPESETTVETG